MPYPADVSTRVVTGSYITPASTPARGVITFTPTVTVVDDNDVVIIASPIAVTLNASGAFSVTLPCTDDVDLYPAGWAYQVTINIYGVAPFSFNTYLLTGDGSSVDIFAEIIDILNAGSYGPVTTTTRGSKKVMTSYWNAWNPGQKIR